MVCRALYRSELALAVTSGGRRSALTMTPTAAETGGRLSKTQADPAPAERADFGNCDVNYWPA